MREVRQSFESVRFVRLGEKRRATSKITTAVLRCGCGSEFEVQLSKWNNNPARSCRNCSIKRRKAMINQSMKIAKAGG